MKNVLAKRINDAFDVRGIPKGRISVETYDDEGAQDFFYGKAWNEPSVQELRHYESAMLFFTPEAFRYYFPAFMLAELRDPEKADIIADNLSYRLAPDNPDARARLSLFTNEQLLVIAAFFEYCAAQYEVGDDDGSFTQAAVNVRQALKSG